jgi:hypothetical protein
MHPGGRKNCPVQIRGRDALDKGSHHQEVIPTGISRMCEGRRIIGEGAYHESRSRKNVQFREMVGVKM